MQSPYFIYDGIKSTDMGLYIVRIGQSNNFVEVPYWGGANIEEERHYKKITPYFYRVNREPIEFTVQFILAYNNMRIKDWTPQERNKIAKWLIQDTYKEFQTSDDLSKYYYAICTSPANLNLMGNQGYIELTFQTNSPYAWSPIYVEEYDLSDNEESTVIELENRSNVLDYYYPKLEIELKDDATDIALKNLSDGGRIFSFTGLYENETVSIDNENKLILSNNPLSNPFSKFNRNWFRLVYGVNYIEVTGKCVIKVKSQFPIAQ